MRAEECRLEAVNLAMSTSQRVRFERCMMAGVELRGAKFEGVAWWDCDLSDADCGGVYLVRAHLHGSRLDGLVGGSSLHPVSVDAEQFAALAERLLAELGIEVTQRPVD